LLIAQMDGFGAIPPHLLTCVLPLANLVGIVASRALLGRNGSPYSILVVIFSGIILLCGGLILSSANLLIVGLIALVSGMCYASNTILLSFIPMQYTERNMVASIIDVFDFASYVGASISTYLLGRILESFGFAPLPVIWLAAAVIAILLARYTERMKSTKRNGNVSFQRGS
jgi:sugar phosphate permease